MSLSAIVLRTLDFIAFAALPCESDGMTGGTIAGRDGRGINSNYSSTLEEIIRQLNETFISVRIILVDGIVDMCLHSAFKVCIHRGSGMREFSSLTCAPAYMCVM